MRYIKVARNGSEHTITAYENDLQDFLTFVADFYDLASIDQIQPVSLDVTVIRPYLRYLRDYRKLALMIHVWHPKMHANN